VRSLSVCLYLVAATSLVRADDSLLSVEADPPPTVPVERPAFEVGLYTGGFLPSADHQFYNVPLFPGQKGDPALPVREDLKTISPLVGLRFMYFIASWFGVEGEVKMVATATKDTDKAAKIYGGRLGLVFQAPNLSKKIVPFVGIGDGFDRVVSADTVLGNDTDWAPHVTAGLRFLVHRSITVRFDARYLRAPSMQAPYHVNTSVGELMLGVSFRPGSGRAEESSPTVSTTDTDRDGVLDASDKCPAAAEDKDLFDDTDGCPELDNDTDGVTDADDKCPLEAEDKDGVEDTDGCVDKDNDADGVADTQDKCPNEPEDRDTFKDADGCPDPDNDGDGFTDGKDTCPNEAEIINGVTDDDGCADKGDSFVVVSPDRLELLESITFKKGVLQKSSDNVLGQIGATLRAHQSILRLRITVHVQPTANPAADRQLTETRAFAIREWLIRYGIDEKRLDPRGFGGERPLIDPKSKSAAAINDRVELIILERQ